MGHVHDEALAVDDSVAHELLKVELFVRRVLVNDKEVAAAPRNDKAEVELANNLHLNKVGLDKAAAELLFRRLLRRLLQRNAKAAALANARRSERWTRFEDSFGEPRRVHHRNRRHINIAAHIGSGRRTRNSQYKRICFREAYTSTSTTISGASQHRSASSAGSSSSSLIAALSSRLTDREAAGRAADKREADGRDEREVEADGRGAISSSGSTLTDRRDRRPRSRPTIQLRAAGGGAARRAV